MSFKKEINIVNLTVVFIAFIIAGCPPIIENGETDTDTTATDSIPVDTVIIDTTFTDTTVTDTIVTDTLATDTIIEIIDTTTIKNKYETEINKLKKHSYFQLYFKCPACNGNRYTDDNIKMEDGYQKLDRRCLSCNSEFKIKRKKDFYEIKPK